MPRDHEPVSDLPFSERTQAVIAACEGYARQRGLPLIGSEFLLFGLLADERMAEVLEVFGATPERVTGALNFIIGQHELADVDFERKKQYSTRARHIVNIAEKMSIQDGKTEIDPEYLLRGIMVDGEGIAAGVLETFFLQKPWKS